MGYKYKKYLFKYFIYNISNHTNWKIICVLDCRFLLFSNALVHPQFSNSTMASVVSRLSCLTSFVASEGVAHTIFCWRKRNSYYKFTILINGMTEPVQIANMFGEIFKVINLLRVIKSLTRGKSSGHDGFSNEHFLHCRVHLPRVLKILFNLCISDSCLSENLMKTIVVPIVKFRTGNAFDGTNIVGNSSGQSAGWIAGRFVIKTRWKLIQFCLLSISDM